jgi:hypothetical protein
MEQSLHLEKEVLAAIMVYPAVEAAGMAVDMVEDLQEEEDLVTYTLALPTQIIPLDAY